MKVFLSTINGWDGNSIIGIYSNPQIALSKSIEYLLNESISQQKEDLLTPFNERIDENDNRAYDITNSDDTLIFKCITIDE